MVISVQTLVIAGLNVHIHSQSRLATATTLPVAAIFLLHGRLGSATALEPMARKLLESLYEKCTQSSVEKREPIVVTFDQRNHGSRLVNITANYIWNEGVDKHNDKHALDMYSIQIGTARDVSFLIDFLPSYLYSSDERAITEWVVAGISLGGHSTWITLKNEPRVKIGIPIIGCPDYLSLISQRATMSSVALVPPFMPQTMLSMIHQTDPASSTSYKSSDSSNPFLGKKILVLSGRRDTLVPWSSSENFVEKLQVGNGLKKVVIADAGHECTEEMVAEMITFIWKEVLT